RTAYGTTTRAPRLQGLLADAGRRGANDPDVGARLRRRLRLHGAGERRQLAHPRRVPGWCHDRASRHARSHSNDTDQPSFLTRAAPCAGRPDSPALPEPAGRGRVPCAAAPDADGALVPQRPDPTALGRATVSAV